jgi:trehalose synthase
MADHDEPSDSKQPSFSEVFFPARPLELLSKARSLAYLRLDMDQALAHRFGLPISININYVKWLEKESMLHNAHRQASRYSGKGVMWQNPYAKSRPRTAIGSSSVWYTAYPISTITGENETILSNLGDQALWSAFKKIGITGLHTGPMKMAGGLSGWTATPSIDGHFDRISTRIDDLFGTEAEFRAMCEIAARHNGIIIDDIVPGHTGKGADFRLAEMNHGNYPGIYHMVEIDQKDWGLLPDIPEGKDSANLDQKAEAALKKAGYIIGKLQRVIFYEPEVKETNWSVTKAVRGVDGIKRRWVYLHYFKDGQPTINWLDPSFAGMQLVVGDALHSLGDLGSSGLRLDANGFLGVEVSSSDQPAWSEGHPLSEAANQLIAGMVRKMGGFTFQELNLSMDDIKAMSVDGADLSYDFVNRPAYHHALATADTEFLRLTLNTGLELGIDPASLVHALQNHDELTFELVHFWTIHKDDDYTYHGQTMKGIELREIIRNDLKSALTGNNNYNLPFTENGVACTTASIIAAILGFEKLADIKDSDVATIQRAHLLLVMFNALQPGVFALSGWDLSGALTIDPKIIAELIESGDTRWINRGSYDLMGKQPEADESGSGMPKARGLYGTLPEQLHHPNSFSRQLKKVLDVRADHGIAIAHQVDIPDVPHKSLLAMVHKLPDDDSIQATVLNFSGEKIESNITSEHFTPGAKVTDALSGESAGQVDDHNRLALSCQPYQGMCLLFSK